MKQINMTDNNFIIQFKKSNPFFAYLITGLLFAILWASASTATKFGLTVVEPFVLSVSRFFIAGAIMLTIAHLLLKKRIPAASEWKQLAIYGLLNISIYLGMFVIAMKKVSPGLGSLAVASNPVLISLIAAIFFNHKVTFRHLFSLLFCITGVIIASFPLIQNNLVTKDGLIILFVSMLAYSAAAIYFSKVKWNDLHILTINGWQTIFGGIFLLPVLLFNFHPQANQYNTVFWQSVLWLAIPVSIVAVSLWLHLIRQNPVTAAYWLFLCPIVGFVIARLMMNEPITYYTIIGVILVIGGLVMIQKRVGKPN